MPEQILALQAYLDRLGRRQRWVLGSRALLQAMAALLFLGIAAAVGFSFGLTRGSVLGWIGTAGGLAMWLGFAWPLLPRWRESRSRAHQADLVEDALPALRSRLRTVVDRSAGPPERVGSTVLLARAAARAQEELAAKPWTSFIGPFPPTTYPVDQTALLKKKADFLEVDIWLYSDSDTLKPVVKNLKIEYTEEPEE